MPVLLAVLLTDGVAVTYNKIGVCPFGCIRLHRRRNRLRKAHLPISAKAGAVGYSPFAKTTASHFHS